MFIGKIDAEAETAVLCPPDAKNQLIGGMSDLGDPGCSFPVVSLLSGLERLGPFGK